MLALHLDNLLFLLFVAIAILFQILTRAATKAGRRSGDTKRRSTSPSQRARPLTENSDETDQERIRKFLEALGQPTTSKPPPPVAPKPTYQEPVLLPRKEPEPARRPSVLSPVPPLTTRPQGLPQIRLPQQTPPTRGARTFQPKLAEAPKFEVHEGPPTLKPLPVLKSAAEAYAIPTAPTRTVPRSKIDIAAMLRSTSGLRDAIILREIFGPPRSLQPLDLVGSV